MIGLTYQTFNCMWQDNAEMSQCNNLSCLHELPKVWQSRTAYNSFYRFLSQVKLMLSIQHDSIQVSRLLEWLLLIWHILGSCIMQHPTGCKNPEGNKTWLLIRRTSATCSQAMALSYAVYRKLSHIHHHIFTTLKTFVHTHTPLWL
jgi:hypothetical protein